MPLKSASGGRESHNRNSMQFSCRWLNHLTDHPCSCNEKDSLSPQIVGSLSMTLTVTTRCGVLKFKQNMWSHIVWIAYSASWENNDMLCREHTDKPHTIYTYALGRCMWSCRYVYEGGSTLVFPNNLLVRHSTYCSAYSCFTTQHPDQMLNHATAQHSGHNKMRTSQAWTDVSSNSRVKGGLPACCILSPQYPKLPTRCSGRMWQYIHTLLLAFNWQEVNCVRMYKRHGW